jgi:hypothetical protein
MVSAFADVVRGRDVPVRSVADDVTALEIAEALLRAAALPEPGDVTGIGSRG